ncbi:MAG: PD40 domain-containing protein, partial [Anaerolineae bacterium]|nr:PD40 domain-containing protein [Anaerolineae bacterium]
MSLALMMAWQPAQADGEITSVCPGVGVQAGGTNFQPGGIILTAFDKSALWVYDVDSGRRYPLPETTPCSRNCHLSPDATWITYFNDLTNSFNKMRLDGTERTFVAENAAEVSWWDANTYLVWTPGKQAYIQPMGSDAREYLDVHSVISIQPGGRYGILIEAVDNQFRRWLVNLEPFATRNDVDLGLEQAYFNAQSWSPDGAWLAYVAPFPVGDGVGGEIFAIQPGMSAPVRWTSLTAQYGAERINGLAVGELSWSPDGTRIAFWVTEITGADVTANLGSAV